MMWKFVLISLALVELSSSWPQYHGKENLDELMKEFFGDNLEGKPSYVSEVEETVEGEENDLDLHEDTKWNVPSGEVGGLAVDRNGLLGVFHRAERIWKLDDFSKNGTYLKKNEGPISSPTLMVVDPSGKILKSFGENEYYMPHGLTIDKDGNYWLTDVARHQVFKINKGEEKPTLTLGTAFVPAKDNQDLKNFCKPTDVAVASNGEFFVSDGYCNSRVLKYSPDGNLIGIIGEGDFAIPHSLAINEDLDIICVADREHERITCYKAGIRDKAYTGLKIGQINENVGRVFAIEFGSNGRLYAVSGNSERLAPIGMTIELGEDERGVWSYGIVSLWSPEKKFQSPHDLAVSLDESSVYVGELKTEAGSKNLHKLTHKAVVFKDVLLNDNGKIKEEQDMEIVKKSYM
ncbi:DgyrCDS913 [Dimorphilus gyrociliatus]|uniref:peptidylamidoglycolate lyase n=1 Tax=Dimorphilus gyrociliatus TaxID=2664684 RepID=A0A7I8V7S5_9ANNE|nr:DgyrCDS913 [Dimorphilus gyrociliatus]